MSLFNSDRSWGWPARLLHWLSAAVILFMLGLGFYMANFVQSMITQLELTQLHKSIGFVAFVLAVIRIGWRLANPAPALPRHMSPLERRLAHGSHFLLYVLIVVMPVSGWLMASASPLNDADAYPVQIRNMVFGLFELPDPWQPGDEALSEALWTVHFGAGVLLSVLVLGHIAAAVKHQSIDRDGLIRRMILG
ncbi:MAG TPA: cytochrome b [Thermohalobaculum sp.]|nr:cytochrome b [Thermohalobaculum sp.]